MESALIILLPICLATAFMCSGMEAGIFALGRWRIAQQMRAGKKRATRLYGYLQKTENFLWTILVGNTLAAFGALWITAVALIQALPAQQEFFWAAYLGVVFVFYALADLLPKMLFRSFPNRLCLILAVPFSVLHLVLSPVVAIIEQVANLLLRWTGGQVFKGHVFSNRNELRLLMEETSQGLTTEEKGMLNRVLELNTIQVRQILLPFARFPVLQTTDSLEQAYSKFREIQTNSLPVWQVDKAGRRVAGFIHLKSLLFRAPLSGLAPLQQHLSPVFYLHEDVRLQEALGRMQKTGNPMAVVISRDRREIGITTIDEILKVIFGEVKL